MPTLHIDLQEGFTGEPISITINNQAVYQRQPRTRYQIGLAESIEVETPHLPAHVKIENVRSGQSGVTVISSDADSYLGVNLMGDGSFKLTPSQQPFHYL